MLNADFVSIKVDREERPDVDRVYMTFVQATTGSGGWPMSVWLTPALEPFYGGTYFPPTSRWGRPGFVEILEELARAWREERDKVEASAATIVEPAAERTASRTAGGSVPGPDALDRAVASSRPRSTAGAAASATRPKFPRPSELLFLLREHARTGAEPPLAWRCTTLRAMALGGMRDHLGGGFHRYSVDGDWRVPHFEKMLYDQAQLVLAYLEAAQATGDRSTPTWPCDTLALRPPRPDRPGGRRSTRPRTPTACRPKTPAIAAPAQDGGRVLHLAASASCARCSATTPRCSASASACVRTATRRSTRRTSSPARTCSTPRGRSTTSRRTPDRAVAEVEAALARSRGRLLGVRAGRPRPHLDDKVLTAWNGLMIAAFARAGRIALDGGRSDAFTWPMPSGRPASSSAAVGRRHADAAATLPRRRRRVEGYAEDYAYLASGCSSCFRPTAIRAWLEWALALQRGMDELFWDPSTAAGSARPASDPSVLLRLKETTTAPSRRRLGGVLNLLALAHLDRRRGDERADRAHARRSFRAHSWGGRCR